MINSNLPNINNVGNGSEVRAVVAKLIGYVNTFKSAQDAQAIKAFFTAASAATTGKTIAVKPDPELPIEGE